MRMLKIKKSAESVVQAVNHGPINVFGSNVLLKREITSLMLMQKCLKTG